jgi:predicted transcriptional regulator
MAIGIRLSPEQEQRLDRVAHAKGLSRSACVRQALDDYLTRHGGESAEARRQSELIAQASETPWSEQLPDWSDWTA